MKEPLMPTKTHSSTTTKGKITATTWALTLSVCGNGLAIYVVGNSEGLLRHIHDKAKLGFSVKRQIVVEIDKKQHEHLLQRNKELGYPLSPEQIICGDIFEVAKQYNNIGHLDLDFAHTLDERTHRCLAEILVGSIRNVHIVFNTRTRNKYWEKVAPQRCRIPENRWCGGILKMCPTQSQKVTIPEIIRDLCDHDIDTLPYRGKGRSPMLMMVLNKQKFIS